MYTHTYNDACVHIHIKMYIYTYLEGKGDAFQLNSSLDISLPPIFPKHIHEEAFCENLQITVFHKCT